MNTFVKNAIRYLIFALPAVALVVGNSMFFPFITAKAFLFRMGVELASFLYIALAISDKSYRPRWKNGLTLSFIAFVGAMLIADIFAIDPSKAFWSNFERMDGFVNLIHVFGYFFVASNVLRDKKDWKIWILSQIAISIYMVYFSFLQLSGEAKINQGGVRVDGSLGNAIYLAVYLMFHFFFLVYIWLTEKVDLKQVFLSIAAGGFGYAIYYLFRIAQPAASSTSGGLWILLAAILVSTGVLIARYSSHRSQRILAHTSLSVISISYLVVLYHTATRGAILGLIGGVYVAGLFLIFKAKDDKRLRNASAVVLISITLLIGLFYVLRDKDFVKNSQVLSRFASLSLDTKGQARNYVWPMALQGFKEHPILGWGQEGFHYVFQKYYVPEMITQESWFDRAHNSFLDWLVAGGILGIIPYIALYILALIYILKSSAFNFREKSVLLGVLSAYTFQSMTVFDNLLSYILFASLLALVSSGHDQHINHEDGKHNRLEGSLVVVCVVGFLITSLLVNARPYLQNKSLASGTSAPQLGGISKNLALIKQSIDYGYMGRYEAREHLVMTAYSVVAAPNISNEDKSAFIDAAVSEMYKQLKDTPKDARSRQVLGEFLISFGQYDLALPVLREASDISPKKQQIQFALAGLYISKGINMKDQQALKEGLEIVRKTYELSPNLDPVRLPYIKALIIAGDINKAVGIIREVEDPTPLADTSTIKAMVGSGYASDAINMLRKVIEVDPNNADAYTMIGDIYLFLNQPKSAISILEEMAEAIPAKKAVIEKNIATVKARFKL